MIWNREEYLAHMSGEFTGREMLTELFGLLIGLEEEWRAQGASEEEIDLSAFGFDSVKKVNLPVRCGILSGITPTVISDTELESISIDQYGRRMRLLKASATIPLPMEYPVKTMEDWLKVKPMYAFSEGRIDHERLLACKKQWEQGHLTIVGIPGGFDEPRQLLGEEELCVAYYEQPELIHDILSTIADTSLRVLERVLEIVPVDCLAVHEDMAGKSGPLAGPQQVQSFIKPYYRKIWDELARQGCRMFSQDSDGNMNAVIDAFLDCGLTAMYPCEPMAGMDLVEIRKQYPQLSLKGGIDKHALRKEKIDILRELEYKLNGVTRGGKVCFALDHRIPNGVPIENYRYYVKTAREILGLSKNSPSPFVQMAF